MLNDKLAIFVGKLYMGNAIIASFNIEDRPGIFKIAPMILGISTIVKNAIIRRFIGFL